MPVRRFHDRREAGRVLAQSLRSYGEAQDTVVLALPRGGVPVAYEVVRAIHSPLDIFAVRKLGVPGREELAMGAIGSGGIMVIDAELVDALQISAVEMRRIVERERAELEARQRLYRDHRTFPGVAGKTILLIDDGLATGASMFVALRALREENPDRLVVAVPVGPPATCEALRRYADGVVCCLTPQPFGGVGDWYVDFDQVSDAEVRDLLRRASLERSGRRYRQYRS